MELIFEIGCEEIPARFIEPALQTLKERFVEQCRTMRIGLESVRALGTPQRLTLLVEGIASTQQDLHEERTGPPAAAAYRDGQPTKAAEGFAKGLGVALEDLYLVKTEKGEYLAAKVFQKGAPTEELLPGILSGLLHGLNFPKSMRWAANRETFARPVRWIVAVLDGKPLSLSFADATSSNLSRGHRFAAPGVIALGRVADYERQLLEAHVVVDPAARKARIREHLASIAQELGAELIQDPGLVDEVANLVEEPHAVALTFSEHYLELPDEVLISSMRSHQRYFAFKNPATGKLTNHCGIIYNTPVRDPRVVAQGNHRVLKARLDDARFFWQRDLQRPLAARLEDLSQVVWLARIGSVKNRCERIATLAGKIAKRLGMDAATQAAAERAGLLSKADLVSQMVYEFPDLQGVMGREYALRSGEGEAVAVAIHEQYLPKGAEDGIPQTDAGSCVALAERLDAMVGCFGIGLVPTSTADPYGLRRAALGTLRILQGRAYGVGLAELIALGLESYAAHTPGVLAKDASALTGELVEFIGTRLRFQLAAEFSTDVVDAVLAAGFDDVLSVRGRVEALQAIRAEADFEPLAVGFKRVVNILKKQAEGELGSINPELLAEPAEKALFEAFGAARMGVERAVQARDWRAACAALIALKAPVDGFFDHVTVMSDDLGLRHNRLALLGGLRQLFFQVADISNVQAG